MCHELSPRACSPLCSGDAFHVPRVVVRRLAAIFSHVDVDIDVDLDDDFVRLLYILAMRQAENIIAFHQPEVDFKVILGQCFAGFKGQVGAACARAMAMRALSYNAHGRRVLAALAVSRPQRRDQLLHIN